MMGRVHKNQRLIINKGATDTMGITVIVIIIIILILLIIFRNVISDIFGYLLSLIKNIFPV